MEFYRMHIYKENSNAVNVGIQSFHSSEKCYLQFAPSNDHWLKDLILRLLS